MSDIHDQDSKPVDTGAADPPREHVGRGPDGQRVRRRKSLDSEDELVLHEAEPNAAARGDQALNPDVPAKEMGKSEGPGKLAWRRQRRRRLPLILFVVTCLSTFWVGANHWLPWPVDGELRRMLLAHWQDGLTYMGCVLAILFAHEMGHFLATVRYGIPASFPYFIPFPISPIGTMGAVIGMDGLKADRKELFDIGLAGPLSGLVVALPVMWIGVTKLDFQQFEYGPFALDLPLLIRAAVYVIQPSGHTSETAVWFSHLNPYFMAGWVGLLVTGLNMMPVSQLDGGHVVYTLFGRKAHWIARTFVVAAILVVVVSGRWEWSPMILIVLLIGPDHPPTRNDHMPLGCVRTVLGISAILIPVFCFPLRLIILPM
ncbi:MAG: site-2 protease family protein [Pirellulaceae bacterium]